MADTDTREKFVDNFYALDFVLHLVEDGDNEAEIEINFDIGRRFKIQVSIMRMKVRIMGKISN